MKRVFDFDCAIVRAPGESVTDGLRSNPALTPDLSRIRAEHAAYIVALREAGLEVDVLPALEQFPDSIFVEDPALVFPEGTILLRPGAPSRLGEAAALRKTLGDRFDSVLTLEGEARADGGDVLVTPDCVFIGLSERTNREGAAALSNLLARLGRKPRTVETSAGVLHLKSAVALLDEETLVATPVVAASRLFDGFRLLVVPETESAAANLVRVNDTVLMGDCYPRSIAMVSERGLRVRALPVTEIAKLDAGLSCMSLRWRRR